MSAKFLHVFADDNTEFQKQIGCMNGIFQMFDRQHLLTGRRGNQKRLPSGRPRTYNNDHGAEHNVYAPQIALDKSFSKSSHENQRASMELSGTSFSSSSCSSSFSSLEVNKPTHHEQPSMDQMNFAEKSIMNSPRWKSSEPNMKPILSQIDTDTPRAASSIQYNRKSLEFRDVVKDNIYKDMHSLSVKTSTKEDTRNNSFKPRDSPRPPLSKSMDGTYKNKVDGSSMMPDNVKESLRILPKLKEAPWYFTQSSEPPRPSHEAKDTSLFQLLKETARFSYDGRETSRNSLDSGEGSRITPKLRESPRLSLDGRSLASRDLHSTSYQKSSPALNHQQETGSHRRLSSAVAKLMGLENMPTPMNVASQEPSTVSNIKTNMQPVSTEVQKDRIALLNSVASAQHSKQQLHSPRNSLKDPSAVRLKNQDSFMKPVPNARMPVETVPRRQQDKVRVPHKTETLDFQDSHVKQQNESIFSEIERKLKKLESQQSNKDLRALKQILDAMEAKGLLENNKGQEQRLEVQKKTQSVEGKNQLDEENAYPSPFQSPIVIMKPAESVKNSSASNYSVIPVEDVAVLPKLRMHDSSDRQKALANSKMAKDRTPRANTRESSSQRSLATEKKSNSKTDSSDSQKPGFPVAQVSPRRQSVERETSSSSAKSVNSLSPRLQHKKLGIENKSRLPPSPESYRPPRESKSKQLAESVSPRSKPRKKPTPQQKSTELVSKATHPSQAGDEISVRSDSSISLASQVDGEVTCIDVLTGNTFADSRQANHTPSARIADITARVMKQKESLNAHNKEAAATENDLAGVEQPSPISVLDASFYQDNLPSSPIKEIDTIFKGSLTEIDGSPTLSSGINHKKLEKIKSLVGKLKQLSAADDEATSTDHIASLCDSQNPDHRYVSEILLASGLLMKDLSSIPAGLMPIKLHPSGHPINPDLFLVLEQTKSGLLHNPELINAPKPKAEPEKLHRKLLFDLVNEILGQKLDGTSSIPQTAIVRRLTSKFPSGQQLLQDMCSNIDQTRTEKFKGSSLDEDNTILDEDVLSCSEGWEDLGKEIPVMALEIERMIFKDLIAEVLTRENITIRPQAKAKRLRRQLFAKQK